MNVCSDIRKVASIRRASDIRKDIRSHIRKVFSPWPHSQGFAARAAAFHTHSNPNSVYLNIHSPIKENPGCPSQETGGECLRPGYILC
nr:MAG TPA: hypothetical protein [Bacteriophage sp.]